MEVPRPDVLVMLREATATAHRDAERHRFIRELFGPAPSRMAYARYLGGLVEIYGALEDALRTHRADVGFLADARLARRAAIQGDLAALTATLGGGPVPVPGAARAYARRISAVAPELPRLAAHAYVRYLGDLAGGQLMGTRVQVAFGDAQNTSAAPTRDVSQMYRFEGFASVFDAATHVRVELARIGGSDASARDAMVDEAVRGFALTSAVFEQIMESGVATEAV